MTLRAALNYGSAFAVLLLLFASLSIAQEPAKPPIGPVEADPEKPAKLPGLVIDVKNRKIDIQAKVCMDEGMLEFIACINDTKEHESILTVQAVPMHIHAALLMLGAKNGNPAMIKPKNEEKTEWVHLPPRGDPITVSLVIKDKDGKEVERPIHEFIQRIKQEPLGIEEDQAAKDEELADLATQFDTFLFAGSQIIVDEEGNKQYLADESGHVISISSFGDELICLPTRQSQDNSALIWEINPTHLPKVGTKVTLRLTLKQAPDPKADR